MSALAKEKRDKAIAEANELFEKEEAEEKIKVEKKYIVDYVRENAKRLFDEEIPDDRKIDIYYEQVQLMRARKKRDAEIASMTPKRYLCTHCWRISRYERKEGDSCSATNYLPSGKTPPGMIKGGCWASWDTVDNDIVCCPRYEGDALRKWRDDI